MDLLHQSFFFSVSLSQTDRSTWRMEVFGHYQFSSVQFSSVAQSCPTLCQPMHHSTPGPSVHLQLPEFTQTHVHRVGDAIQPSHSLSSPSPPAPNPSQHQSLFQWVNSSHEVAKVMELQLYHQSLAPLKMVAHFQQHERTLHIDITRWSVPRSDWLYSWQPKMENLYISQWNKTWSLLWLRS